MNDTDRGAQRKLVVQQWATVDTIVAEEDGGLSFVSGEPFDDTVTDNPFQNDVMAFIDTVDTMLIGANTYAQSKDYWPYAKEQGSYGEKFNSLAKVVASSKLEDAPWGDFPAGSVTRDPAATVRELKQQSGKDILLWGSLTLMRSLLDAGVVDEVRVLVCPVARAKGTRLFEQPRDLRLIEATGYDNGLALLRYEVRK
jgi:dihydrofolate reductase